MSFTDFYLRAADRAALDAALQLAGLLGEDMALRPGASLDRIRMLTRITGYDDGEPIVEAVEGYHANLRLRFDPTDDEIEALRPVTIAVPATPYRGWA